MFAIHAAGTWFQAHALTATLIRAKLNFVFIIIIILDAFIGKVTSKFSRVYASIKIWLPRLTMAIFYINFEATFAELKPY